jgi:hypothetical protein
MFHLSSTSQIPSAVADIVNVVSQRCILSLRQSKVKTIVWHFATKIYEIQKAPGREL